MATTVRYKVVGGEVITEKLSGTRRAYAPDLSDNVVAFVTLVAAGFIFLGGCTGPDKSPNPSSATKTHPSGLEITLNGPSILDQEPPWDASYEAHVENHGSKPIAFAVHPIWLKLEVLTPDGKKVEPDDWHEVDWLPPTDRDLVIIKPGEKRIFKAFFIGSLESGTYKYRGVIRPSPTIVPEDFIRAMREEDAVFLKSECRSPTITVEVL